MAQLIHHECEIFVVVVSIIGQYVEYHPSIDLCYCLVRKTQFAAYKNQSFIAIGLRLQCCQGLDMHF